METDLARVALAGDAFARELADSPTFCRAADLEAMWSQGLALGGTPLNAVVVDGERVGILHNLTVCDAFLAKVMGA